MNSTLFGFQLLSMFVRGACLVALALLVGLLLYRRCSAHSLSWLWRGALVGLCSLPLLSVVAPPIRILPARAEVVLAVEVVATVPAEAAEFASAELVAPPAAVSETGPAAVVPGTALAVAGSRKLPWLAILWMVGVGLVLSRWLVALVRVHRLWRGGREVDSSEWNVEWGVRLRISENVSLPTTWATRRPAVLLPSDAEDWDAETRRTVVAHELSHARRGDSSFLLVAQLATALHWANLLVWIMGRLLRDAQERAADDAVLACGQDAGGYATLLLNFARRTARPVPLAASAMAHPSRVGKRIERVLDEKQSRGQLGAVVFCLGSVAILAATTIVAAAAPQDAAPPADDNAKKDGPKQAGNDRGKANRAKMRKFRVPQKLAAKIKAAGGAEAY